MEQFIVDRHTTPNTPTLEQVPTEKIPIYENRAAVTADLANLSVGQIVATADTGDELAQPVDVVEEGNLHAVSSNAVFNALIPDYSNAQVVINPAPTATTDQTYTCTKAGFVTGVISVQNGAPSYTKFYINDILLACCCGKSGVLEGTDGVGLYPVKAGDVVKTTTQANYGSTLNPTIIYFIPIAE